MARIPPLTSATAAGLVSVTVPALSSAAVPGWPMVIGPATSSWMVAVLAGLGAPPVPAWMVPRMVRPTPSTRRKSPVEVTAPSAATLLAAAMSVTDPPVASSRATLVSGPDWVIAPLAASAKVVIPVASKPDTRMLPARVAGVAPGVAGAAPISRVLAVRPAVLLGARLPPGPSVIAAPTVKGAIAMVPPRALKGFAPGLARRSPTIASVAPGPAETGAAMSTPPTPAARITDPVAEVTGAPMTMLPVPADCAVSRIAPSAVRLAPAAMVMASLDTRLNRRPAPVAAIGCATRSAR